MAFVPVVRASVSDLVFGQLRDAIVSGDYRTDDPLPGERELAAAFQVNRHAVREALRRLQQLGLVRVSQGGATRVLDWQVHAGLDLALSLVQSGDVLPVATLVRDMMDMRACIGVDAARLCARRADATARRRIVQTVEDFADLAPDLTAMGEANIALWRQILQGCGNTAYLLAFNSLVAGALAVAEVPPARRAAELLDVTGHRRLADAIAAGRDAEAAEQARSLLTAALTAPTRKDSRA
ncbi:DNA-binding transcriptional regulator, FadR family [Micromonospora phaseoli]|uniref:DNA-binding transcriptional regulator, FadR family n=1 Tax=Micromonospora phaseoli TaxID=1144548 RepID=A0A1H6Y6I8_9ACTN|nr:GntR family transcriptional regulator [Micromonospora phaseoli]PZV99998.1 GntR family transcriptional regulator [Micromonospora phaseoli]GIJ81182.1 HTH-type transcriptional regulator Mce2R [Micromonospora phaseoli]SEJ35514.1 DNA-binding transcriptional regulator, FadR family [Micromonospora phaseoli]